MATKYSGTIVSARQDKRLINTDDIYDKLLQMQQSEINQLIGQGGDVSNHNILDEYVESYLRSVHYNNYDFSKSEISDYAAGSYLGDKYVEHTIQLSQKITGQFYLIKAKRGAEGENIDVSIKNVAYFQTIYNTDTVIIKNVHPGEYYYVVTDDSKIIEKGICNLVGRRQYYTFATAYNVRDLGGISTASGHSIKYGKLIRGSRYHEEDAEIFNSLQNSLITNYIAYLDLRNSSDMGYHFAKSHNSPICTYAGIHKNTSDYDKRMLADAINYVLDNIIKGNSVYYHCVIGAHRTGLLSSILLSLLDVPQCEIDKDYELTSFDKDYDESECLNRNDDIHGYKSGNKYIRDNYNSSWKNYAIQELGISEEKIEAFKDEMIIDYVREQNIVPVYFETTYEKLKNMKDRGVLTPGAHYRMIDYETIIGKVIEPTYSGGGQTVVDADSANHKFDLLLLATSKNTFDCKVKALHSARDTENYFINDDLSKWQLWYDIDNNKDKYNWVSDNCKGVIYRMIDDKGNDVPYDFKNILFNNKLTFDNTVSEMQYIDESDIIVSSIGSGHTIGKLTEYCISITSRITYNCDINIPRDAFIIDGSSKISVSAFNSEISFACGLKYSDGTVEHLDTYFGADTLEFSGSTLGILKHNLDVNEEAIGVAISIAFSASTTIIINFEYFRKEVVVIVENAYNNNIIEPYIIKNKQILNKNIFALINSDDIAQNNIVDLNCDKNTFSGNLINNKIGAYCSYNNLTNCNNVKLIQSNALDTISNCMNTTLEPYISEQNISNKGSVNSTVLYKHSNSSEEIITNE